MKKKFSVEQIVGVLKEAEGSTGGRADPQSGRQQADLLSGAKQCVGLEVDVAVRWRIICANIIGRASGRVVGSRKLTAT